MQGWGSAPLQSWGARPHWASLWWLRAPPGLPAVVGDLVGLSAVVEGFPGLIQINYTVNLYLSTMPQSTPKNAHLRGMVGSDFLDLLKNFSRVEKDLSVSERAWRIYTAEFNPESWLILWFGSALPSYTIKSQFWKLDISTTQWDYDYFEFFKLVLSIMMSSLKDWNGQAI